jgi:hypothetical protein
MSVCLPSIPVSDRLGGMMMMMMCGGFCVFSWCVGAVADGDGSIGFIYTGGVSDSGCYLL